MVWGDLALLACPAMTIFCLGGMAGGGKQPARTDQGQTPADRRQALQLEMREIDRERLARGEITTEEFLQLQGTERPEAATPDRTRPAGLAAVPAKPRRRTG